MTDEADEAMQPETLLQGVGEVAQRERLIGGITGMHRWWARRPQSIARTAVYLTITDKLTTDERFLNSLAETPPQPTVLTLAIGHAHDAQWRWALRDALDRGEALDPESTADMPRIRVLDPFAGGGSIPAEAARLGCEVYAGDVNEVAFHILEATLLYPRKYGAPDRKKEGSGANSTWAGLARELEYWAGRTLETALRQLAPLLPAFEGAVDGGGAYFLWVNSVRCPDCGALNPIVRAFEVERRRVGSWWIIYDWSDGRLAARLERREPREERSAEARGQSRCLRCDQTIVRTRQRAIEEPDGPLLSAVVFPNAQGEKRILVPTPDQALRFAQWDDPQRARLAMLREEPFARGLNQPLPDHVFISGKRSGLNRFAELYSDRQLLVGLTFAQSVQQILCDMVDCEISADEVGALSTYLSFFLAYWAERNSLMTRWDPRAFISRPAFSSARGVISDVFVESTPRMTVADWLSTVVPAIEHAQSLPRATGIFRADAALLPFEPDYFDAIVTDPPYYDAIPYESLSRFPWGWESPILGFATPECELPPPEDDVDPEGREHSEYEARLISAFREAHRVLKPGRLMTMLLTAKTRSGFDQYITLGEQAGFELFGVKLVPSDERLRGTRPWANFGIYDGPPLNIAAGPPTTYLAFASFRKPRNRPVRPGLLANPAFVIRELDVGRPILYDALARVLLDELNEADVEDLKLPGARGSRLEVVMEALAETDDLAGLLQHYLGNRGLRDAAKALGVPETEVVTRGALNALLTHSGFLVPSSTGMDGPAQVLDKLEHCLAVLRQASEKAEMRGQFLDGCTAVERLIRTSLWSWAQLAFGPGRDQHLSAVLVSQGKLHPDLEHLSFGDIVELFRGLPDAIAMDPGTAALREKLGRSHVYLPARKYITLPSNEKVGFEAILGLLVSRRNDVEHNRNGYWSSGQVNQLRDDLTTAVHAAKLLVGKLIEEKAVPRVATLVEEIKDRWGKLTYRFNLDGGTPMKARFSTPMALGDSYLYFTTETNPTPVDPPVLSLTSLGRIP